MTGPWLFRPLLLFWSVTIGLLAGGAVGLQFAGPVSRTIAGRVPAALQPQVRPPARVPAHAASSIAHPAPPLKVDTASIPEPDPALLEPGAELPDRMLPRVAAGQSASRLYQAAFDPAERHPRVALVIDGAGLDRAMTEQVMATLPAAIDLAYSAYAPGQVAADLARAGRAQGRECLVSIPMEPSGFPAAEEGDRALQVGSEPRRNRANLEWALSSVAGCVGATGGSDGLQGERFAESAQAFGEMLATVEFRGLLYLDVRPGAQAAHLGGLAQPRTVDVLVDTAVEAGDPADAQAIDRHLAALEQIAARRGYAIGLAGPPRPVLLDRIAVWAHGLAARGIVLVPVSAIPPPEPDASPVRRVNR